MAKYVYTTLKDCRKCTGNNLIDKHWRPVLSYPTSGPFVCVAIDILGPLPETLNDNHFALVMTDGYSRLARAVPTSKTPGLHIASHYIDNGMTSYSIPTHVLTKNGTKIVSKCFKALCVLVGTNHLTTMVYHPQTSWNSKQYNKTIIAIPRHHVAKQPQNKQLFTAADVFVKRQDSSFFQFDTFQPGAIASSLWYN